MLSEAGEHAPGAQRPSSGLFSAWLCCEAWEDTGVSLVLEEAEWSSSQSRLPDSGSFPLGSPVLSLGPCSETGATPFRVLQPLPGLGPSADFHSHTHTHACAPSAWNAFSPHTWGGGSSRGGAVCPEHRAGSRHGQGPGASGLLEE